MTGESRLAEQVWALTRVPLPLPGAGDTMRRFDALADVGSRDLALAKLVEPHHDAAAILADLGEAPTPAESLGDDSLWAVWAAEPPTARLTATRTPSGWLLQGRKAFCSGARIVTSALVTAAADDGARLFAVDVRAAIADGRIEVAPADWVGAGMRRADTRTLTFVGVPARAVGGPDAYVARPGFWHGAIGVAACWLGGARAVGALVRQAGRQRPVDDHVAAHLGAITAVLDSASAHLSSAAERIDAEPAMPLAVARRNAQSCRATIAATVDQVLARTARALGPAPLAFDPQHSQRVADLEVFVRQHHAERDLADLGRLVLDEPDADA